MSEQEKFECYAIIELFGHNVIAGLVSEQTIGGASLIRVDVPEVDEQHPSFTKFFGGGAIYAMTPTTEAHARAAAAQIRVRPVSLYILPEPEPAPIGRDRTPASSHPWKSRVDIAPPKGDADPVDGKPSTPLPAPVATVATPDDPDAAEPTRPIGRERVPVAALSAETVATLGAEHTVVTPLQIDKPRTLAEADADELIGARMGGDEKAAHLRNVLLELRIMSEDGVMPTIAYFDANKPASVPTASGIMKRHNLTWGQLAAYAKLTPNKPGRG